MSARRRPLSRSFLFPSRSIAMTHFLLRLYDWLHVRPLLRWGLMCCALLALLLGVGQAHFKEDIGDFLPDASRYGDETAVYAQANAGIPRESLSVEHFPPSMPSPRGWHRPTRAIWPRT